MSHRQLEGIENERTVPNLLDRLQERRRDMVRLFERQLPTDGELPPISTLWPLAMIEMAISAVQAVEADAQSGGGRDAA